MAHTVSASKTRLDKHLADIKLVNSRSQAENLIRLGNVKVNSNIVKKPGAMVSGTDSIQLTSQDQYVSRAGLKLASVANQLKLDFSGKVVLDVGSSTGGFTDYALRHGAKKVIAVDVGTNQLHPSLYDHPQIELHEKTDIRDFKTGQKIDLVVADVSFISLQQVLPAVTKLMNKDTLLVAMAKPQFEVYAEQSRSTGINKHPSTNSGFRTSKALNKGVIKNEKMRREVLKTLEEWLKNVFVIINKADSEITGAKGNRERFYLLRLSSSQTASKQSL